MIIDGPLVKEKSILSCLFSSRKLRFNFSTIYGELDRYYYRLLKCCIFQDKDDLLSSCSFLLFLFFFSII